uniref:Uncharacterized protein n=1 Tax=Rhizophora mucronata TaxID=61149 RepID=A0A2P2L392_RHIMU
MNKHMRNVKKL